MVWLSLLPCASLIEGPICIRTDVAEPLKRLHVAKGPSHPTLAETLL